MKSTQSSSASTSTDTSTATQTAEQIKTGLAAADDNVTQGIQILGRVHQARLARASRTAAALTEQYGADDPRVKTAQASVAATSATSARVSMVSQQLATPVVQVAKTGWALQGRVLDAQLQPAARFTVFLVDAHKTFLRQYGFAYTDDTGYFLINYPGDGEKAVASVQLYIEIANTKGDPVYLSPAPFQPVLGAASFENIVLPAGGQPIGDPPPEIRAEALPSTKHPRTHPKVAPPEESKS